MVLVNGLFLHLHYHFITIFFPVPTSAAAFATYVPLDDSEAKGFFFFQLCYPADHVLPSSLSNKLLRLHLSTVLRATVSFPRPNDKNWWNFHDIWMNTNQKLSMFTEINVVVRNCFIGWENNYKLTFWSDKRYNSLALIGQELLSCISCPMRIQVCKYRTTLPQLESKLAIFNQLCFNCKQSHQFFHPVYRNWKPHFFSLLLYWKESRLNVSRTEFLHNLSTIAVYKNKWGAEGLGG